MMIVPFVSVERGGVTRRRGLSDAVGVTSARSGASVRCVGRASLMRVDGSRSSILMLLLLLLVVVVLGPLLMMLLMLLLGLLLRGLLMLLLGRRGLLQLL